MKTPCLVVVQGGVAYAMAPKDVRVEIVDIDNINAGDAPTCLPRGMGFERLVNLAHGSIVEGKHFVWAG